ncbi:MAG: acyltransferase family protein [Sciscionella sp.]
MRTAEIRPLTGLRILAAAWVLSLHLMLRFRDGIDAVIPGLPHLLEPVWKTGALGVDLFFALSGYVLTLNYLDRMGSRPSLRFGVRFLWLRLARVWPLYLLMTVASGLWLAFTAHVGRFPQTADGKFTAFNMLQQLSLTQLWSQPYFSASSWDGPAWSISAEWMAYILFPLFALLIFRLRRGTSSRALLWLAIITACGPTMLLIGSGAFYTPFSWLPRILMQFLAGGLACAAVQRMKITDRTRRRAGWLSLGILVVIIAGLYLLYPMKQLHLTDPGNLVAVLFLPLVVALAVGRPTLPALLGTRFFVYLGQISFALYLVHEDVFRCWSWVVAQFSLRIPRGVEALVLLALLAIAFGAAALLFKYVEEPARRWMRGLLDPPRPPPLESGNGHHEIRDGIATSAVAKVHTS